MNKYLEYMSEVCNNLKTNSGFYKKITIIMGNESCDLDSAISSLVYGYILFLQKNEQCQVNENSAVLSLLNVSEEDLPLKTEVIYFLQKNGIQIENLLTRSSRDVMDLSKFHKNGSLELVLVDHHTLSPSDEVIQSAVVEIIDHRPRDVRWNWNHVIDKDIRIVGSCCSLVGEKILSRWPHFVTEEVAKLLIGPIVIDTFNLSPEAGRATEVDHKVMERLESLISVDRNSLLNELVEAKSDIGCLSTQQVLRKDLKIIGGIPVPGAPVLIETLSRREGFAEDIRKFMRSSSSDEVPVLVLLGLKIHGSSIARDLAVCSANREIMNTVVDALWNCKEPELKLEEVFNHGIALMRLFSQRNIKATRKHITPLIQTIADGVMNGRR